MNLRSAIAIGSVLAQSCSSVCACPVQTASGSRPLVRVEFADFSWETQETDLVTVSDCDDVVVLARSFERHQFFTLQPQQTPGHEVDDGCMPTITAIFSDGHKHLVQDHEVWNADFFAIAADASGLGYDLDGCWEAAQRTGLPN